MKNSNIDQFVIEHFRQKKSHTLTEAKRQSQLASKRGRASKPGPRSLTKNSKPVGYATIGIPGQGKSTIADKMKNTDVGEFDRERRTLGLKPHQFSGKILDNIYSRANQSAKAGRNTILSNTGTHKGQLKDAISRLKKSGYSEVKTILAPGSIKAAVRRNRKRSGTVPGQSQVPKAVMGRMIQGVKSLNKSERKEARKNYKELHKSPQGRFTKPALKRAGLIR